MTADRLAMTRAERVAAIRAARHTPSAAESAARAARPMKRCPDCGTAEVASWYCTACLLPMGPDDWQTLAGVSPARAAVMDRVTAAREAKRAAANVRSAHPSSGDAP